MTSESQIDASTHHQTSTSKDEETSADTPKRSKKRQLGGKRRQQEEPDMDAIVLSVPTTSGYVETNPYEDEHGGSETNSNAAPAPVPRRRRKRRPGKLDENALVSFNCKMTVGLRRQVRGYAAAEDLDIQDVVEAALVEYLRNRGVEAQKRL